MLRYSSTKLESLRFDAEPSPAVRAALIASGWERHPFERKLYLCREEVRPVRLRSASSFLMPGEADAGDPLILAELHG